MIPTRIWTLKELQGGYRVGLEGCMISWDHCRDPISVRNTTWVQLNHAGRNGTPCLLFQFEWDNQHGDGRVFVTAPGCTDCKVSHDFQANQIFWTACPIPPWTEACKPILRAYRLKIVKEVFQE